MSPLTPRELQILGKMSTGMPQKCIASELGTSVYTIKNQVASIYYKLEAQNNAHAVFIGRGRGLI